MSLNRLCQGRQRRLPFCTQCTAQGTSIWLHHLDRFATYQATIRACCVSLDKRGDDDGRRAKGDWASMPHPSSQTPLRLTGTQGDSQFILEYSEHLPFLVNSLLVWISLTWNYFFSQKHPLSMISRATDEGGGEKEGGGNPRMIFPASFNPSTRSVGRSVDRSIGRSVSLSEQRRRDR